MKVLLLGDEEEGHDIELILTKEYCTITSPLVIWKTLW